MAGELMATFIAYIWRLIVILAGFGAASLAAATFFVIAGIMPLGNGADPAAFETVFDLAASALLLAVAVASFASLLLAAPVFILAILAEYFKWNGFLFHGVSGAVFGFAATGIWNGSRTVEGESHLVMVGAAAGIIGATVYWLIAGRNAGKLFERIIAERAQ
jgi:hypothetical protein